MSANPKSSTSKRPINPDLKLDLEMCNSDRVFLHLSDGWALGYDPKQWMIMRGRKRLARRGWTSVSFIACTKRTLRRVIREKGIQLSPEATEYIEVMPNTFREWMHWYELAHSNLSPDIRQPRPP
jgi:hypothetical protein